MEELLYYIRDNLVGTHYFIYAFFLLFLMFAIIGYLFKQRYAKYQIILNNSQNAVEEEIKRTKKEKNNRKEIKKDSAIKIQQQVVNTPDPSSVSPKPIPNTEISKPVVPEQMPNNNKSSVNPEPIVKEQQPTNSIPEI